MKVYILALLCLTVTVVTGQGESNGQQGSVSDRSENAEGYGPERVNNPPSASVTVPTAATTYTYSAALTQSVPVGIAPARLPEKSTAAQPPMMLMPYSFQYGVDDDASGLDFGHKESSDGLVVTGTYYVQLPDGRMETVNYKADDNGYVAEVLYDGEAKYGNAQPQKGAGSSSGTSAQLQVPSAVPASPPASPTRAPPPLPVTNAAPKPPVTPPTAPAPVWPAVNVPAIPAAPTVARTPSVIPATSAPVAAPAPSAVPAPTAVWSQTAVTSPAQSSQVTAAQANTPPAGFVRSVVQPEVQAVSYGQPSPPAPAPVPAYPVAPIPLTQRNTPLPPANPY